MDLPCRPVERRFRCTIHHVSKWARYSFPVETSASVADGHETGRSALFKQAVHRLKEDNSTRNIDLHSRLV